MKIRWTSESVRFRITPTELELLGRGRTVTETLPLPGAARWCAALRPAAHGPTLLDADRGDIAVDLGAEDLRRLAAPDTEGVYLTARGLRLIIEKDFPCAHPRAAEALEQETETFAAPPGFAARKGAAV